MLCLVTFFPKNIIRLKFLALASCLLSTLYLFKLAAELYHWLGLLIHWVCFPPCCISLA